MTMLVEAAVESLDDALAAMEGGAGRLELCAHLAIGGTTPSAARVESLLAAVDIPLFVMIRPRGGDFVYSDAELTRMCEDVAMARALGAAGVVLGVLDATNHVDLDPTAAHEG